MSDLQTNDVSDLVCATTGECRSLDIQPGDMVQARGLPKSFGIVISRRPGLLGRPICDVMWSRGAPDDEYYRKTWRAPNERNERITGKRYDMLIVDEFVHKVLDYKQVIEETYNPGVISSEHIKDLINGGAKLTHHIDGRITVIRSEPQR